MNIVLISMSVHQTVPLATLWSCTKHVTPNTYESVSFENVMRDTDHRLSTNVHTLIWAETKIPS